MGLQPFVDICIHDSPCTYTPWSISRGTSVTSGSINLFHIFHFKKIFGNVRGIKNQRSPILYFYSSRLNHCLFIISPSTPEVWRNLRSLVCLTELWVFCSRSYFWVWPSSGHLNYDWLIWLNKSTYNILWYLISFIT